MNSQSNSDVRLGADGLPPIVSLDELLRTPLTEEQQKDAQATFETEESEESDDYEALMDWRNQVVRNWNEEDRKYIEYGKHIGAKIEELKNNFKDIKGKEERFQRRQLNWSEYLRIAEAIDAEKDTETVTIDDLLNFDRTDDPSNLLGNRWLCKGSQAALTGPTGVGKSSLETQISIRWCLGLPAFDIKPVKPMRILIIQAENDTGDLAEGFQDMTDVMGVTDAQMDQLRERLSIQRVDSITGENFVNHLEHQIRKHNPDIVFVDPFLAYVGDDALQQKVMSRFLRTQINPILRKTGVLLFWIHHVVKQGGNANGQEKIAEQNKYAGLGSSDFQNAMREVIALTDNGDGTFKLEFTKRGRRTGLVDHEGKPTRTLILKHHESGIVWCKAEGSDAKASKKERKAEQDIATVRNYIVDAKRPVTLDELKMWAPTAAIGEKRAANIAKTLAYREDEKIWAYTDNKRDEGKKGPKTTLYTASKPTGDGIVAHMKASNLVTASETVVAAEDDGPEPQEELELI